jgi:D-alanyl-D-alanine endopeptidase (penicillin-binding protein 7)
MKSLVVSWLLMFGLAVPAVAAERDPTRLALASVAVAAAPLNGDTLLVDKRTDWVVPIASITKLMTAMVVLDSGVALDEWLEVVPRDYAAPTNAYTRIRIGSQVRRGDLLHIALMSSENMASYLLARHHPEGYVAFISAMNDKAKALGMLSTRFVDSTGLSADNQSTAGDLVKLTKAAYRYSEIREYSTSGYRRVAFRSPKYSLDYGNTNVLVHRDRWDVQLSKTGYLTAAGRCLVMVTEVQGEPLVMVMLDSLGTRSPLGDAGRIRRWLETGDSGRVASAALNYEREKSTHYAGRVQAQALGKGPVE